MTANDYFMEAIENAPAHAKAHIRKILEREEIKRKTLVDGSYDRLMVNRKHKEIYDFTRTLLRILR